MTRFGTCSWKYPSWKGLVYSKATGINYLEEYAKKYNTVEIDQWFWSLFGVKKVSLPKEDTVEEYVNSVPKDFMFTIKMPNSLTLTHFYQKDKSKPLESNPHFFSIDLFNRFMDLLDPMLDQIGMLMFQFEYLNKKKMPSLQAFIDQIEGFLSKLPDQFPYGIEIRNPNYLKKEYFDFLNQKGLGMVFLEGYYMPGITKVYQDWKSHFLQQKSVVIRLHGGDRSEIEEKTDEVWDSIVEPKDEDLKEIAHMIHELSKKNMETYVNVNNHYEGSAPLTIQKLEKLV